MKIKKSLLPNDGKLLPDNLLWQRKDSAVEGSGWGVFVMSQSQLGGLSAVDGLDKTCSYVALKDLLPYQKTVLGPGLPRVNQEHKPILEMNLTILIFWAWSPLKRRPQ